MQQGKGAKGCCWRAQVCILSRDQCLAWEDVINALPLPAVTFTGKNWLPLSILDGYDWRHRKRTAAYTRSYHFAVMNEMGLSVTCVGYTINQIVVGFPIISVSMWKCDRMCVIKVNFNVPQWMRDPAAATSASRPIRRQPDFSCISEQEEFREAGTNQLNFACWQECFEFEVFSIC